MRCDAKPQNLPSTVPHNQQAVEQTKRDCRHDEQIHRGDAVSMIMRERLPTLRWRASSPGHILGHAGLSDFDAELEEFAMDPWRSPQRIGDAHLPDKLANLWGHSRPSATRSRLPAPVQSEAGTMPANNGVRLDYRQRIANFREHPINNLQGRESARICLACLALA